MCFLKLQDHYKIDFMTKNDLVISQAYRPQSFAQIWDFTGWIYEGSSWSNTDFLAKTKKCSQNA